MRKWLGLTRKLTRQEANARLIKRLREAGMDIGENVALVNVTLDTFVPFLIKIGSNCIITHATILAHDAAPAVFGPRTRVGRVTIGDHVFIGAGAVILPGVTIGSRSVIGANTTVARDIPPNSLATGSPARVVGSVDDWLSKKELQGELIDWPGGIVPSDEAVAHARREIRAHFGLNE